MTRLQSGFGLDQDGYIMSDVSVDNIHSIYLPCVHDCIDELTLMFPERLQCVYLYGSVARGDAVPPKSDLDLIAMFTEKLHPEESTKLKKLSAHLSKKYRSFVRDVGIAVADYEYTMDPNHYYEGAFLKELSICVYGEDPTTAFGPYQLTSKIAVSFNGDIGDVVARTIHQLNGASDQDLRTIAQNFARKFIRTCYSIVMERSQIWTTRLHQQADVSIHYFPEKKPVIDTFQHWLEEPPTNRRLVLNLIEVEGKWVAETFEREVVR